jgi:hypothetical protein
MSPCSRQDNTENLSCPSIAFASPRVNVIAIRSLPVRGDFMLCLLETESTGTHQPTELVLKFVFHVRRALTAPSL